MEVASLPTVVSVDGVPPVGGAKPNGRRRQRHPTTIRCSSRGGDDLGLPHRTTSPTRQGILNDEIRGQEAESFSIRLWRAAFIQRRGPTVKRSVQQRLTSGRVVGIGSGGRLLNTRAAVPRSRRRFWPMAVSGTGRRDNGKSSMHSPCRFRSASRIGTGLGPPTVSANSQLRRPTTKGRIAFSQTLLSIGQAPLPTKRIEKLRPLRREVMQRLAQQSSHHAVQMAHQQRFDSCQHRPTARHAELPTGGEVVFAFASCSIA